jgi:hypothetical protein
MTKRKPILLIDESEESVRAADLLKAMGVQYVEYDIRKFEESCCGDLSTTSAPSLFAVEGTFNGLEKINEYISVVNDATSDDNEPESAYW